MDGLLGINTEKQKGKTNTYAIITLSNTQRKKMKKVILMAMVSMMALFSGCAWSTPSTGLVVAQMYDKTKTIIVKGKEVAILNADLLDDNTLKVLNSVDETLTRIDNTKEIITK